MALRRLFVAAVAFLTIVGPLGLGAGGSSTGREAGRADPAMTELDAHAAEMGWDFSDASAYTSNAVDITAGHLNLSQALNSTGDVWTQLASLGGGNEREDFSAAWDDVNNQMIIHGGYYYISGMQNANWFQNLYTYSPATNSWTDRGAAMLPAGNVGVWDPADQCFITHGGYYLSLYGNFYYHETWAWYPATGTWTQLDYGPTLLHHAAVWDPVDNVMLVFGGTATDQSAPINSLWEFNLSTNAWTQRNPIGGSPPARASHSAVWDTESGQMIIFGGYNGASSLSDVWAYNYTQNAWTQKSNAQAARRMHTACWDEDQSVMIVFGGNTGASSNETLSYDPSADSWAYNANMPSAGRVRCAAAYDKLNKQMLVYGGEDGIGAMQDEFQELWSFKFGTLVLKYLATGSVQSKVSDLGDTFHSINKVSWYGDQPAGTTVTFRFRSGNNAAALPAFSALANGTAPVAQGRYLQWNLTLQPTADRLESPVIGLVKVECTLNNKPNVSAGEPQQGFLKRTTVTLNGSASDLDGDALTYVWTQSSGPNATLNSTSVPVPSFSPEQTGTYLFRLTVSDGYSNVSSDVSVSVGNRPPRADPGPNITGLKKELVTFHGAGHDDDDDKLAYEWSQVGGPDVDLTQTDRSRSFLSFLPVKIANYTFQLVVGDGESFSDPARVTAVVGGQPPEAALSTNKLLINMNGTVELNAENSTDIDGEVKQYLFEFGDGKDSGWIAEAMSEHTYALPGVYNATVKVRDDDKLVSNSSAPVRITVRNLPPVAKAQVFPLTGNTSALFRFSVPTSSTYDPDGRIVSYEWDFGDGARASGSAVSHTYKKRGMYEILFRVTDDWGDTAEVVLELTVLNRGPYIDSCTPSARSVMVLGYEQLFTISAIDPENDNLTCLWKVDGIAQSETTGRFIHKPERTGDHRVNVTVSDGVDSVSYEWILTVRARPVVSEGESPDLYIGLALVIIICGFAGAGYYLYRRDKQKEAALAAAAPPAAPQPAAEQPYAPAPDYPAYAQPPSQYAAPAEALYPPPPGAEPLEATAVDESGEVLEAELIPQPQQQPPQPPAENWTPVQEPYSKQLWNK